MASSRIFILGPALILLVLANGCIHFSRGKVEEGYRSEHFGKNRLSEKISATSNTQTLSGVWKANTRIDGIDINGEAMSVERSTWADEVETRYEFSRDGSWRRFYGKNYVSSGTWRYRDGLLYLTFANMGKARAFINGKGMLKSSIDSDLGATVGETRIFKVCWFDDGSFDLRVTDDNQRERMWKWFIKGNATGKYDVSVTSYYDKSGCLYVKQLYSANIFNSSKSYIFRESPRHFTRLDAPPAASATAARSGSTATTPAKVAQVKPKTAASAPASAPTPAPAVASPAAALQSDNSQRYRIISCQREPGNDFAYIFNLELLGDPPNPLRLFRSLQKEFREFIKEDYVETYPDANKESTFVEFTKYAISGKKIEGRAEILSIRVVSLFYDPVKRSGVLSVKMNPSQYNETRKWIRANIETLARDKNIALVTGEIPPAAKFYLGREELKDENILEIEFKTE